MANRDHPWRRSQARPTSNLDGKQVRRITITFHVVGCERDLYYNAWAETRDAAEEEFWTYIDNDNTCSRDDVEITG